MTRRPHRPARRLAALLWATAALAGGAATAIPAAAVAAEVAALRSPDGRMALSVDVDGEGRIRYALSRDGRAVLAPSTMAFLMRDGGRLERNLAMTGSAQTTRDERWDQPWGESRFVRDRHNAIRVDFAERDGARRQFAIEFRLFDDGLGFRYAFPARADGQPWRIDEEMTDFSVAGDATAWWIPAGEHNRYEYLYDTTPLREVTQAHTPITLKTAQGLYLSFHEAALVDYSAMWLRRVGGTTLRSQLSPSSRGWKVERTGAFTTPWRTVLVADTPAALYKAADITLNLNEPNRLGDVSWVKPHRYMGIWWGMHLDTQSWSTGPKHGATTANAIRYIDFAAANGMKSLLIEGWNVGWDGNWFASGRDFDFAKPTPDFDMERVAAHAKRRGITIMGHHETGANICVYERQLGRALDYARANGQVAIKTGYVADAGGIIDCDASGREVNEWHDGQRQVQHHLTVVTEAAKRRIAINPHEPVKDTGLRRTYPNWVTREGARGQEYQAWGVPPNEPEHHVELVFTRMLSGPFDYTPGVISLVGRGGRPIPSTLARQLALYVVLYSPIQMAADLPENYAANPAAFRFIRSVGVDWDDTRLLAGEIGDLAVFARKERGTSDWFIGAITDEEARTVPVRLDFLTPGRRYRAEIYRDGDGAHYQTNRFAFATETRIVTAADTLTLALAPGGGQAIRLTPAR